MTYAIVALLVILIFALLLVVGAIGNAVKQLEKIETSLARLASESLYWRQR